MEIEYDDSKAKINLRKHGISFEEAATSLYDPMALCKEDPDAKGEFRWILVGKSNQVRLLTVVYTLREERIRLISARKSTRREAKNYA
jgi:uncharacterized DUF497 family protein